MSSINLDTDFYETEDPIWNPALLTIPVPGIRRMVMRTSANRSSPSTFSASRSSACSTIWKVSSIAFLFSAVRAHVTYPAENNSLAVWKVSPPGGY